MVVVGFAFVFSYTCEEHSMSRLKDLNFIHLPPIRFMHDIPENLESFNIFIKFKYLQLHFQKRAQR